MEPVIVDNADVLQAFSDNTADVQRGTQTVEKLKEEGRRNVRKKRKKIKGKYPVNATQAGQEKPVSAPPELTGVRILSAMKSAMVMEHVTAINVNAKAMKDTIARNKKV